MAGSPRLDDNYSALHAILVEWRSARSYSPRQQHLTNGTGSPDWLNGPGFLRSGETVFNDGTADTINCSGLDWYFCEAGLDRLKRR